VSASFRTRRCNARHACLFPCRSWPAGDFSPAVMTDDPHASPAGWLLQNAWTRQALWGGGLTRAPTPALPQRGREEIGGLLGRRTLSVGNRGPALLPPPLGEGWGGGTRGTAYGLGGHGGDPARIASRLAPTKTRMQLTHLRRAQPPGSGRLRPRWRRNPAGLGGRKFDRPPSTRQRLWLQ
jgi:hypothetical protein